MVPYLLLVFFPLMLWRIGSLYRIKLGNKVLYEDKTAAIDMFMFIFLLLLSLRGLKCGNDTKQYLRLYEQYSRYNLSEILNTYDHESGYKLLNKIVRNVFNNFQMLLVITSVTCVFPLWYFYKKESEIPPLTIALFLSVAPFVMYFSGIRQAMSMSLGILAWYAAREKRLIRFILVVVVAMFFHNSAFMLLVVYPMYRARITKKWLWFVVPCMFAVYIYRNVIFNYLFLLLWKEYDTTPETGATMVLFLLIVFAVYSYMIPDEKQLDQDIIAMRNILLLSVVLQIFAMLHPLSMRMNYYFLLYVPILIPKIAKRCKKGYSQVAQLSVVVMTVFFIYYFLSNGIKDNDDLNIFPYIPFWQN